MAQVLQFHAQGSGATETIIHVSAITSSTALSKKCLTGSGTEAYKDGHEEERYQETTAEVGPPSWPQGWAGKSRSPDP